MDVTLYHCVGRLMTWICWPQITQITQIKEHFVVVPADRLSRERSLESYCTADLLHGTPANDAPARECLLFL